MEYSIIAHLNTAKPQLHNEHDAVVAVLHLAMRELGFRCTGLTGQPSSTNNVEKPLPDNWNQSQDSYSFQYKHTQSSLTFTVKCVVMNDKLLVHGAAKEDNKICSLELSVKDYTNENSLDKYDSLYKDLDKLTALFKINISSKLLPDLNKPGYEAASKENESSNIASTRAVPPRREPVEQYDYPPNQPPIHDPLRIPGTGNHPGYFPGFGVGYGDLNPPFPGIGALPGARGNLVGPNHPGFGPRVNDPYAFDPNFPTTMGGPRMPPRGTVPAARFDPVGPPAPTNPTRNNQNFGDEFPPPSFDNMYM